MEGLHKFCTVTLHNIDSLLLVVQFYTKCSRFAKKIKNTIEHRESVGESVLWIVGNELIKWVPFFLVQCSKKANHALFYLEFIICLQCSCSVHNVTVLYWPIWSFRSMLAWPPFFVALVNCFVPIALCPILLHCLIKGCVAVCQITNKSNRLPMLV